MKHAIRIGIAAATSLATWPVTWLAASVAAAGGRSQQDPGVQGGSAAGGRMDGMLRRLQTSALAGRRRRSPMA